MAKTKSSAVGQKSGQIDEVFAQRMLEKLRAAPALMTIEEVYDFDDKVRVDNDGFARRMALATFTRPGAEILDLIGSDDKFAAACAWQFRAVSEYIGRLEQLFELMKALQAKLRVALATRSDMAALEAMAERAEKELLS